MKKLSLTHKIVFVVNNLFAFLLLLSYLTVFISPAKYPISGILNFSIPFLWIVNGIFLLFWILNLKKQFLLSFLTIALGWFQFQNLFSFSNDSIKNENAIKILSYNVRQFYSLKSRHESTYANINEIVIKNKADIVCFQEFRKSNEHLFPNHEYKVINKDSVNIKTVVVSKHPIINSKFYGFGKSNNSAVYADITVKEDTIRVFSTHFESLNLNQDLKKLKDEPNRKLVRRLSRTFKRQIEQIKELEKDIINSPYPVVFSADVNNTALSYLYRYISNLELKDTFSESEDFYGSSFTFFKLPVRIDMIFTSQEFTILNFRRINENYSDHRPVMAEISL